jgi:hypothetical protein
MRIEKQQLEISASDLAQIKGTPLANATVNRDLAALKHMLQKAELLGLCGDLTRTARGEPS